MLTKSLKNCRIGWEILRPRKRPLGTPSIGTLIGFAERSLGVVWEGTYLSNYGITSECRHNNKLVIVNNAKFAKRTLILFPAERAGYVGSTPTAKHYELKASVASILAAITTNRI